MRKTPGSRTDNLAVVFELFFVRVQLFGVGLYHFADERVFEVFDGRRVLVGYTVDVHV